MSRLVVPLLALSLCAQAAAGADEPAAKDSQSAAVHPPAPPQPPPAASDPDGEDPAQDSVRQGLIRNIVDGAFPDGLGTTSLSELNSAINEPLAGLNPHQATVALLLTQWAVPGAIPGQAALDAGALAGPNARSAIDRFFQTFEPTLSAEEREIFLDTRVLEAAHATFNLIRDEGGQLPDLSVNPGLTATGPGGTSPEANTPAPQPPPEMMAPAPLVQQVLERNRRAPRPNEVAAIQAAYNGNDRAAFEHFRVAIEGGLASPRTLTMAGLSAYNIGNMDEAARWAGKAFTDDPTGPLAPEAEAVFKLAGRKVGAIKDIKPVEVLPVIPSRRSSPPPKVAAVELSNQLIRQANAAIAKKDFTRARTLLTTALRHDPESALALHLRAVVNARLGNYEAARKDAHKGLAIAKAYLPLLLTRAFAAARNRDFKSAKEDALSILLEDAKNPHALRLLAFAQAGLKDRAGMLETLRRAAPFDRAAAEALEAAEDVGADSELVLLFSDSFLFGESGPQLPRPEGLGLAKALPLLGSTLAAAFLAGGLILIAWRRKRDTPLPAPRPDSVGPFRLLGTIGAGGMGVVYKAEDPGLSRFVALKRMRDEIAEDPRERERFIQEARIVSKLDHPGIVRIYSVYEGPEGTFLVFELVDGKTLSEILGMRGALPFAEARAFFAQACEAVSYAHEKRVVHRDLKPSNIMQDSEGRVRVMDFGIARAAKDALTRLTAQGTIAGTPAYMAPEQEEGRCSPASDVYALGVCFFEMLTGRLPFEGSGIALYQAKRAGKVPPLRVPVPAGTDAVIAKALHPDPALRYASPKEFAAALAAVPAKDPHILS